MLQTKMLEGIDGIIFDMDGTLTDSMWIWPEVDRIFLKKYHLTPPPGFAKALEGKSVTQRPHSIFWMYFQSSPVRWKMCKRSGSI